MFYDKRGLRSAQRLGYKGLNILWDLRAIKGAYLKVPPTIIKHDRYNLIIGRGNYIRWVGILYDPKGEYKIAMKPRRCIIPIKSHWTRRDAEFEANYEIHEDVLYIELPDGTFERESWWNKLPDVSDNPSDQLRKMGVLQQVQRGL